VPLGLELDRFVNAERSRGQLRAELGIPADVPLVGIVARLVPIKAHEVFLRAAAILAAREAGARFLIVGDGERRAELEALSTNLGLGRSVEFLGWRPDLDRVYADLDLVVLCSRNEGLPVALIEAQAAGRPVVATRVGGVPDLVVSGDTGLLVPPDDPDALARAIQSLLDDVEMRDRLGKAGRRRVVPAYNAERLLEDIDLLYRELARHGPRLQPQ
jgi:glycosyltransferase involved in cell wall biosynthesis